MPTSTKFNLSPQLQHEKLLAYDPPMMTDCSHVIPGDITNKFQLITSLESKYPALKLYLDKHIGSKSTYQYKDALCDSLCLITLRLIGNLDSLLGNISDSEQTIIVSKITEGISHCTPGFHNRVLEIILSWSKPKNLSQLLHVVRENLVNDVAVSLNKNQEVHIANRVFTVANTMGLGVRTRNKDDIYRGNVDDQTINNNLIKEFNAKLTPFNLVLLISDCLKSCITEYYSGANEQGYVYGEVKKITSIINKLLHVSNVPLIGYKTGWFIIQYDDSNGTPKWYDLDWQKIEHCIFLQLVRAEIFTCKNLKAENLIDLIAYGKLKLVQLQAVSAHEYINFIESEDDLKIILQNVTTLEAENICQQIIAQPNIFPVHRFDYIKLLRQLTLEQTIVVCQIFKDIIKNHISENFRSFAYLSQLSSKQIKIIFDLTNPAFSPKYNFGALLFCLNKTKRNILFELEIFNNNLKFRTAIFEFITRNCGIVNMLGESEQLELFMAKSTGDMKYLAAYSLLKKYEKQASNEQYSYFSKSAWDNLKELAKLYFPQNLHKEIDNIHRTTYVFFSCITTYGPRYNNHPGDKLLCTTNTHKPSARNSV